MKRAAFILATVATLGVTAVAAPAPAEARGGFGPGLAGGLIAGALIGGLASNAYGYGPGYGYGSAPGRGFLFNDEMDNRLLPYPSVCVAGITGWRVYH